MRFLNRKTAMIMTAGIVLALALMSYVKFAEAWTLQEVSINGADQENWSDDFSVLANTSIAEQRLDLLAGQFLSRKDVYKVNLDFDLPRRLNVVLNDFRPECFILDRSTGRLFGLDRQARLISLTYENIEWDKPVFTSVRAGRLFQYCDDVRVKVVLDQLMALSDENIDLFRLIDEVDFGNSQFLKVSVDGLPYRLKVRAEHLRVDMSRFVEFATRYNPDLSKTRLIDLRFRDMIIASGGEK